MGIRLNLLTSICFLMLIACEKHDSSLPNNLRGGGSNSSDYFMPNYLYQNNWSILDSGKTFRYINAWSKNGLTQTFGLSRIFPYSVYNEKGIKYTFWSVYDAYNPNLYGFRVSTTVDFDNDHDPESHPFLPIYDTSKVSFTITYKYYTDTTVWPVYVNLKQIIWPEISNQLSVSYYLLPYSHYPFKMQCDTCIKLIGNLVQGSSTYTNVYQYISPVVFGPDSAMNAPAVFLYNRTKGLLQLRYKNGDIWYLQP